MAHFLDRHPFPQKQGTPLLVQFDNVGAGAFYTGSSPTTVTTTSFNHTATANAYVIVDVVVQTGTVTSVKYGGSSGQTMSLLGSVTLSNVSGSGTGFYGRYGLSNVSGGTSSVFITLAQTTSTSNFCANSFSYRNVVSQSTTPSSVQTSNTGNLTFSVNDVCSIPSMIISGAGATSYANGGNFITSLSGGANRTALYSKAFYSYACLSVNDTSSGVTFSGTVGYVYTISCATLSTTLNPF